MVLSMGAKLFHAPPIRFSETARSRPGHAEAGRRGPDGRAPAVLAPRLADDGAGRAAECAEAGEADVEADLGDAAVRLAQEEHRALDAPALQIAVRRLAERDAKRADEVRFRHMGDAGEPAHVERLGVRPVHRVAGAQHPAVGVLHGPAHGTPPAVDSADPPPYRRPGARPL